MDRKIVVLSFFFDDALAVAKLFPLVGAELVAQGLSAQLLLVDDGSFELRPPGFLHPMPPGFSSIETISLKRNCGHQGAIAVGLSYCAEHYQADAVLVMDADGEDRPEDVPKLLEAHVSRPGPSVVFAARSKRSEGVLFRLFYQGYRLIHYLLTGKQIRFGNFSVLSSSLLPRLISDPNLRVHYAASVVASRIPFSTIPAPRGTRIHGRSKLNLVGLVAHGLAAITCYNEVVGVRLLCCAASLSGFIAVLLAVVVAIRMETDWAIPGWATSVSVGLIVLLLQMLVLTALFTFFAINRRTSYSPPIGEYYRSLILRVERTP